MIREGGLEERGGLWHFAADRGGTFTDVIGIGPDGRLRTCKLLSRSAAYDDAVLEGIRRLLGLPPDEPLPADRVGSVRVGTTVATNALLERTGERVLLVVTRGFRDLIEIGHQARPELFRLAVRKPGRLYAEVIEVDERIDAAGRVLRAPDRETVLREFQRARAAGFEAVAVVLLHAWRNPVHERILEELARAAGFPQISVSSRVMPVIKAVGRGQTTLVDAYLSPVLRRYVESVRREAAGVRLQFMQSAGGLTEADRFSGKDAILSGPAGGVVGCAEVARRHGLDAVIGFDMGGTSTDVCRYAGRLERSWENETGGIPFQAPMLRILTVAAGGGSCLWFDGRKLNVGPESAGARPGPVCYGMGGPLALTDANLFLGRIRPADFPRVFGPEGDRPLDAEGAAEAFRRLSREIGKALGVAMSPEEVALGFVRIANEKMCRPIKEISVARGFDVRSHALVCFGGAGGQHVCAVARTLGIRRIVAPPLAGLLSAWGIAGADHLRTASESALRVLGADALSEALQRLDALAAPLVRELRRLGVEESEIRVLRSLDLRPLGSDSALEVPAAGDLDELLERFSETYRRHFGFVPGDRPVEIVTLRVAVSGNAGLTTGVRMPGPPARPAGPVARERVVFDQGPLETPVYRRDELGLDQVIEGPALVVEDHSTLLVEPGFTARMLGTGAVLIEGPPSPAGRASARRDPVLLEVFNHLFMSVAEQMGATLAQTAHSTNIKERLDFSCAVFDASGSLVANAPHIPVHLGAMGESVKAVAARYGEAMEPGDVFVSNHPYAGGSHLPDVTVVSPVFDDDGRLIFFTASRGHHADIGGRTPGSMPPDAAVLEEEGVVLDGLRLVHRGLFLEEEIRRSLLDAPWPARNIEERISDLKSQIAANQTGIRELGALVERYGIETVQAYMGHIQENAAEALGEALATFVRERPCFEARFEDSLDDGSRIRLLLRIERSAGPAGLPLATLDFTGTAPRHPGNLNAPYAVTRAAVLYAFRLLVDREIPLNDGCHRLLRIVLPEDCLLNPRPPAAVVGGNVETSQRVVDVILGALGVAAASQGTMNNLLFGRPDGGGAQYYETIGGGSGAVEGADGASGVQVHMTNTRITDPEVLEQRFPQVRLERFGIRRGSGGAGRWRGGDGLVRALRFLDPTTVTILSERRRTAPFGLAGGAPGASGRNRLIRADGSETELPGRVRLDAAPGDMIVIETPGGGGYGAVAASPDRTVSPHQGGP